MNSSLPRGKLVELLRSTVVGEGIRKEVEEFTKTIKFCEKSMLGNCKFKYREIYPKKGYATCYIKVDNTCTQKMISDAIKRNH